MTATTSALPLTDEAADLVARASDEQLAAAFAGLGVVSVTRPDGTRIEVQS